MLSSLFPPARNESQGNQPSDSGQKRLKVGPASFHLHTVYLKQIRWKKTILSTQKTSHSLPSPSRQKQDALRSRTSRASFRRHATPGTACPALYGSSMLPLPPSQSCRKRDPRCFHSRYLPTRLSTPHFRPSTLGPENHPRCRSCRPRCLAPRSD